jgi:hypothetical protein
MVNLIVLGACLILAALAVQWWRGPEIPRD